MAIIPVLGVTAAIFAAIVAAVIDGFVFGVIFIIIGTLLMRKTSRRKLGVGLRIFGYLTAIPAFILGILLTGPIALFADLFAVLIATIVFKSLCRVTPDMKRDGSTPE